MVVAGTPVTKGSASVVVSNMGNSALPLGQLVNISLVARDTTNTGNPDIVFWEEVGYGNVWKEISATPEQAARLNVRPGDVIGYIQEGAPMGAAFGDIMFLETLALDPPFPDPFLL
jgi:hypothetical protein